VQLTQLVSARLLAVITPGEEAAALASLAGLAAIARAAQAAARRRASPGSHRRHPSQNVASEIGVLGPAAA
jgi:hypothetical protein